jgi:alkanesulfonate monooxygenase SsuD/methylene tetrahydromethanopterin reductase-like flavin-dependent oxidoreductase (luciferase family)
MSCGARLEAGMARIGLSRSLSDSPRDWLAKCVRAEQIGLPTAWAADVPGADCIVSMTLSLSATTRLRAGAAILLPTRSPLQLATALAQLAALGDGRVIAGFGAGAPEYVGPGHDVPFGPPLPRMREYYTAVNALLRAPLGEPVAVAGEYRHAEGRGFGLSPEAVTTIIGAHGPAMTRLAGRIAEGLVIDLMTPRTVMDQRVALALAEHGSGSFFTAAGVSASVDPDEGVALRRARAEVLAALLLPFFRERFVEIAGEDLSERLYALLIGKKFDAADALLPEWIARSFILVSTPTRLVDDVAAMTEFEEIIPVSVGIWSPMIAGELGVSKADLAEARRWLTVACLGEMD